ncbi:hypothetical protein ACET3X_001872 [Alternaria dauci]|uniref:Uncharacterized protein n=1 Tax=Alternaria dauci TaxID=48095 RepID=A0ABR3UZJ5_9PLEO
MADARALLRQQRAARQQAQKPQKQSPAPATAPASKKRKAVDETVEERKRTRTEEEAGVPAGFFDAGAAKDEKEDAPEATALESAPIQDTKSPEPPKPAEPQLDAAAQAELDAFLNEMNAAKPAAPPPAKSAYAGAVIEAAPMSTAEIAAQAREDQSAQRAKRDEEMEGEKEDAARALEDEFEEMEGLEERVKRLREQREALRSASGGIMKVEEKEDVKPSLPAAENGESESDEDEDEDEDEDWDDWRFRPA